MNIKNKLDKKWIKYKNMKNAYAKNVLHKSQEKRDRIIRFLDQLIAVRLIDDEITNELGASFSNIKRDGKRIVKSARPEAEKKIRDEIEWYLNMRKSLGDSTYKKFLPEILDYSVENNNVYYAMKHYSMPTLRTLIFEYKIHDTEIIKRIESVLNSLINHVYSLKQTVPTPDDYVHICHQKNVINRMNYAIKMNPNLKILVNKKTISINGKQYINAPVLLSAIFKDRKIVKNLTPPKLWMVHGDVHYNNILSSPFWNKDILIDCRGRSVYGTVQCDVALDIGKIYHEIRSYYSIIERNEYNLFLHETKKLLSIRFEFTNKNIKNLYDRIFRRLDSLLEKKFRKKKFGNWKYRAEFIEGKLYISMLPFHMEPFSETVVCYSTGVMRLNEWMEKYHPVLYKSLKKRYFVN